MPAIERRTVQVSSWSDFFSVREWRLRIGPVRTAWRRSRAR